MWSHLELTPQGRTNGWRASHPMGIKWIWSQSSLAGFPAFRKSATKSTFRHKIGWWTETYDVNHLKSHFSFHIISLPSRSGLSVSVPLQAVQPYTVHTWVWRCETSGPILSSLQLQGDENLGMRGGIKIDSDYNIIQQINHLNMNQSNFYSL